MEFELLENPILNNKNSVKIDCKTKHSNHYATSQAKCSCGKGLLVAPSVYNPDHKNGDPILVCYDHGHNAYRFSDLIIGKQSD